MNRKKTAENVKEETEKIQQEEGAEVVEETAPDHEEAAASETDDQAPTELEKALAQVEEFKLALQRERADFINYKKRVTRDNEGLKVKHRGDILEKFLPIVDDFERALGAVPEAEKENDWMTGITLIHRKFQNLMDTEGIQTIDPLGEEFDPNFHEAIGADEPSEDFKSGQVTAVLQKGYIYNERVLRPAMVRVAN